MKFGIMFFAADKESLTGDKYQLVLESARYADGHNFNSVWVPERHFAKLGCLYPNPALLQAALARETENLRLCAGSVVLPLSNPLRITEDWSMVDNLSAGRAGFSLAPGWNPTDFVISPEQYQRRYDCLYEGVEKIKQLWQGGSVTAKNGVGKQDSIRIFPTPVQRNVPMWITAASNPDSFAKAGALDCNVLTHLLDLSVEELGERIKVYRQARADAGLDPASGEVTLMLHTFVGENLEYIREQAREPYCNYLKDNLGQLKGLAQSRGVDVDIDALSDEDKNDFVNFLYDRFCSERALIGTPDSCQDLVSQLRQIGVTEIACLLDFGPSEEEVLASLRHLNHLRARFSVDEQLESKKSEFNAFDIIERCPQEISGEAFYQTVEDSGAHYGPQFRCIQRLWCGAKETLGQLEFVEPGNPVPLHAEVHPVLLDNCFLILGALSPQDRLSLPTGVDEVKSYKKINGQAWSHTVLQTDASTPEQLVGNVNIYDKEGDLCLSAKGLQISLVEKTQEELDLNTLNRLAYRIHWEAQSLQPLFAEQQSQTWIIFADQSGVGRQLHKQLQEQGKQVVSLYCDESFHSLGNAEFGLDLRQTEKFKQHFTRLLSSLGDVCEEVVYLWGLDVEDQQSTSTKTLQSDSRRLTHSLLHLVQSAAPLSVNFRLWVCSQGMQALGLESSLPNFAQGVLWGLGRVIAAEFPHLWGGLIDLDPDADKMQVVQNLIDTICVKDCPQQLVIRQQQVYAAQLRRCDLDAKELNQFYFHDNASYLITGGTGDIALNLAKWMIGQGAKDLILLARRQFPDKQHWADEHDDEYINERVKAFTELERCGARVHVVTADIGDQQTLQTAMAPAMENLPPIRGVMHTAGIAQGGTLLNLDAEMFDESMHAKVLGTWNIHHLLLNQSLDFFVMYSAIPAVVGWIGSGAANYSAANAFLDAFAHYRRSLALPAITINWGPWSDIGMAAREAGGLAQLQSRGISHYSPKQAMTVLSHLMASDAVQTGIVSMQWEQFFEAFPQARDTFFLQDLANDDSVENVQAQQQSSAVRNEVLSLPHEQRQAFLLQHLCQEIASVFHMAADEVETDVAMTNMGLNSLMSIEIRNRIEKQLDISVAMVTLLKGPTISELSRMLAEEFTDKSIEVEEFEEMII